DASSGRLASGIWSWMSPIYLSIRGNLVVPKTIVTYPRVRVQWMGPFHYGSFCSQVRLRLVATQLESANFPFNHPKEGIIATSGTTADYLFKIFLFRSLFKGQ